MPDFLQRKNTNEQNNPVTMCYTPLTITTIGGKGEAILPQSPQERSV